MGRGGDPTAGRWRITTPLVATIIRDGHWEPGRTGLSPGSSPRCPRVRADQAMLQQVWINLLDNAVKYSGKVATPRIEVGTRVDPRHR